MSQTTLVDSSVDFASLAKMKLDAARNPEKTVDKVSEQFESIFINMMLKSMRDATQRSGLMDSQAGRMYESMFDQEVSLHLAKSGSLGLADKIKSQIQRNQERLQTEIGRAYPIQRENALIKIHKGDYSYSIDRSQKEFSLNNNESPTASGELK